MSREIYEAERARIEAAMPQTPDAIRRTDAYARARASVEKQRPYETKRAGDDANAALYGRAVELARRDLLGEPPPSVGESPDTPQPGLSDAAAPEPQASTPSPAPVPSPAPKPQPPAAATPPAPRPEPPRMAPEVEASLLEAHRHAQRLAAEDRLLDEIIASARAAGVPMYERPKFEDLPRFEGDAAERLAHEVIWVARTVGTIRGPHTHHV